MRIRHRVAVVTGASSGIGREIALALARGGAAVGLVARRGDELESVAREARAAGVRAMVAECDVGEDAEVAEAARRVTAELGPVDILVNAAGYVEWRPFAAISDEAHRRMMEVNYWGTFRWIRALLPGMRERRRGAIVNVVAGSGKFAFPGTSGFSASKFAVAGLSEALRRELRGSGVVVSSLYPGSVATPFWNDERIDRKILPPLVRFAPKLKARSVARTAVIAIRLGLVERTRPLFVALFARLNSIWTRLGDLLLWPWFFPALTVLLVVRWLTRT